MTAAAYLPDSRDLSGLLARPRASATAASSVARPRRPCSARAAEGARSCSSASSRATRRTGGQAVRRPGGQDARRGAGGRRHRPRRGVRHERGQALQVGARGKRRIHAKPSRARWPLAARGWRRRSSRQAELIVCLGATAAQALLGRQFRVTKHGAGRTSGPGRKVVATIHPSAMLRAEDRDAEYAGFVDDLARSPPCCSSGRVEQVLHAFDALDLRTRSSSSPTSSWRST